ncbi:hypothetical protein ASPVEDRAFT_82297 [Aspergillus versicolor CBS 583.65]|uniref:F-box domain-containing protein n=1 Tax=Aspergillus versicolor CBS 583.65 TaxID=1036611 RepID=A0A1L9PGU0_ASPVE|nr:uncharacterized protein ASPVEDRAFT_82297 [Aspergillus versicolor CBS 583.65]OJJ00739.1 hypothetical protein ASPVEDRAFT_82297 [Aspergillus versicolor CBS 583.65]
MASAAFPLQTLPAELECAIIRQLDPIALISLSQTNRHFRETVNPKRIHFLERLLALECDESIGGPPIHFSRFGTLDPDRLSPEWEANRWACSSCMRLLPQQNFANQALSRLAYRKPVSGSPAADAVTSWEPTLSRQRRKEDKKDRKKKKEKKELHGDDCGSIADEEAKMRQRYGVAMSQVWGRRRGQAPGTISLASHLTKRLEEFREMGFEEFYDMTYDEYQTMSDEQEGEILDRERQAIERVRTGSKRHLRRCLECRFQRGEFKGTCGRKNDNIGTAKVPMVRGRVKYYGLNVDRYFPRISEVMDSKRPEVNSPVFTIWREGAVDMPWTQYRVRCPGCAQWKEIRAFRFGGRWPRWQPMDIDAQNQYDMYSTWDDNTVTERLMNNMPCNHCFAEANGREALGKELVAWLGALIETSKETQEGNLMRSFRALHEEYTRAPAKRKARIKELVWDLVPLFDKATAKFTRQDVSLLSHRYAQLRAQPDLSQRIRSESWSGERYERFPDSEAIWSWLQTLSAEMEEPGKAEALADWVLSRDESAAC